MRSMMPMMSMFLLVFLSNIFYTGLVEAGNSTPTISIPNTTPLIWKQYQNISIRPDFDDVDPGDTLVLSVNMNQTINGTASIIEQLPYTNFTKGVDWDLNVTSGDFWMLIDDQNIWWNGSSMVDEISFFIAFKVKDQDGNNATMVKEINLWNLNEAPENPRKIYMSPLEPIDGEIVHFWTDEVSDPDLDVLSYRWQFGDGTTGEGQNVTHEYPRSGIFNVTIWVQDDQFQSDQFTWRIEIQERDDDHDGVENHRDAFPFDPAASSDKDHDGYPDRWNQDMGEENSTTGLELDAFPNDPERHEKGEMKIMDCLVIIIISIFVILIVIIGIIFYFTTKKTANPPPSEE